MRRKWSASSGTSLGLARSGGTDRVGAPGEYPFTRGIQILDIACHPVGLLAQVQLIALGDPVGLYMHQSRQRVALRREVTAQRDDLAPHAGQLGTQAPALDLEHLVLQAVDLVARERQQALFTRQRLDMGDMPGEFRLDTCLDLVQLGLAL